MRQAVAKSICVSLDPNSTPPSDKERAPTDLFSEAESEAEGVEWTTWPELDDELKRLHTAFQLEENKPAGSANQKGSDSSRRRHVNKK
jgi:hypothetical protein